MRYPAVIAVVALALVAFGLVARSGDLPYSTRSKPAYELYRQGMDDLNAFRFSEAVAGLERSVAADPQFAMGHAALANALWSAGERERAESVARVADSLAAGLRRPEERLLVELQLAHRDLARGALLDSLLSLAVERLPRDRIVMDIKAQVSWGRGETAVAESLWSELLQLDPNYARAYNWLGYTAASAGDYQAALANLRKYAFLAPDLANPHDSLGEILLNLGHYEEAEAELRRALELQPDFYFSLLHLAELYAATGRVTKATDLLRDLREQFAGMTYQRQIDELLIRAYQVHGLEAERRRATAEYVRLHGDHQPGLIWRAVMLVDEGRAAEGTALLDSLTARIESEPRRPGSDRQTRQLAALRLTHAAHVARSGGDLAAAIEHRQAALDLLDWLAPHEQIPARLALARTLVEAARWEEALVQTAAILQVNPRHLPALALQAQAESGLGRGEEAAGTLAVLRANLALADPDLPSRKVAQSLNH